MGIWTPGPAATAGDDIYEGDASDDVVLDALDGNDILNGRGGSDDLNGGLGDDVLAPGDDSLPDTLYGGGGHDVLSYAELLSDGIFLNTGWGVSRSHYGDAAADHVFEFEEIVGSQAGDWLEFGSTAGGNTIDAVHGGGGADLFAGTSGDLWGGDGRDFFVSSYGAYTIHDFDLTSDFFLGSPVVSISIDGNDTVVHFDSGATARIEGVTSFTLAQWQARVTSGTLSVDTGGGSETVYGSVHADYYWAGGGNDTFYSGGGDDAFVGGPGNDRALAGDGNDFLEGGSDSDWLDGENGDDVLNGGSGADRLIGGMGVDLATYVTASSGVIVSLATTAPQDTAGAGVDALSEIENLEGSAFNDTLTGDSGANSLWGGTGNDTLSGGAGADSVHGGDGDDVLTVGAGDIASGDVFSGGDGQDTLRITASLTDLDFRSAILSSIERLTFVGTGSSARFNSSQIGAELSASALIEGSLQADSVVIYMSSPGAFTVGFSFTNWSTSDSVAIYGSNGDDTIIGSAYRDFVAGSPGDDVIDGGPGTATDVLNGEQGVNTVSYASALAGVTVSLALQGNLQDTIGAGFDSLVSFANLTGSGFADMLTGDGAANVINGGDGDDTLDGGAGADTLIGGAGDDSYVVDDAGDTVTELEGQGADSVGSYVSFALGSDVENLTLLGANDISGAGNDLANVITGNSGANELTGGGGDDTLHGGGGVDTAVFAVDSSAASWNRNVDGTWTVVSSDGTDTLTGVEFLDFTDRDVHLTPADTNFSGDGTSDVLFRRDDGVVATWSVTGATINSASFLPTAGAEWTPLGVGDIGGDGRDDVIWQRDDGTIYGWLMNGGALSGAAALTGIGPEWSFLGAGDFNGDFTDDLAWRRNDGVVYVWTMEGNAIRSAGSPASAPLNYNLEGIGDFNGDGRDDFLWRNAGTGQTVIWEMNGEALAASGQTSMQVGLDWNIVGVGDTDGDGRDDIILQRVSDGMVRVWTMDGLNATASADVAAANPAQWSVRDIGDYNGDGQADILWQRADGLVYAWMLDGATIAGSGTLAGVGPEWSIIPGG